MTFIKTSAYKINLLLKHLFFFTMIAYSQVIYLAYGQKSNTFMDGRFNENYEVLKSDTAIKNGSYKLFYKNTLVEEGKYRNGIRSGIWTFFNLGGNFEFQYDFDKDSLLKLAGEDYYQLRSEMPCLYKGTPLIPYVYLSKLVGYPPEAYEKGIEGRVVLTLRISEKGEILDRYISKGLNIILDSAVLDAATRLPEKWEWIPAKKNGEKVESLYNITIIFDID